MNSSWCPEKEINKKNVKASSSIAQSKRKDVLTNIKEDRSRSSSKAVVSKRKLSWLKILGADFRPASEDDIRIDSAKKVSYLNPDKTKTKNTILSWIQHGYILVKPSSIGDFLQEHKELILLLNEAYRELRKYFLSEDLKLELVSDPEISGDKQLFVYIFTSLPVTDALNKFDEFDEQWWLDRVDRANDLLNFNLRFV